MKLFPQAHATHPHWPMAVALVVAQLRAQMAHADYAAQPTLGVLYITDHYQAHAQHILHYLRAELVGVHSWTGSVGVGVAANNVEYFDEPALSVMLCDLPSADFRVFCGTAPLGAQVEQAFDASQADPAVGFGQVAPTPASGQSAGNVQGTFTAHTALVHADGRTPEVGELLAELAQRTSGRYLFGGLASSRSEALHFAIPGHLPRPTAPRRQPGESRPNGPGSLFVNIAGAQPLDAADAARGVLVGGLSGVAFSPSVSLVSRVTQGCLPLRRAAREASGAGEPPAGAGSVASYTITEADHNLVLALDGEPALEVLLRDLGVSLERPQEAIDAVRATLVGISEPGAHRAVGAGGQFGADTRVRHIVGLDPKREGVAVADLVQVGQRLVFCQRNVQAARMDLTRICAEIRESLEPAELPLELAGSLQDEAQSQPHAARRIAGAIYVSCAGRGGPHFGAPSAELQIVRRALGDVPLVGFFAGGEIAHQHLYGYTGVLTVFVLA